MRAAIDLINLSPSVPLDSKLLESVWIRKDVSIMHLRVFSCRIFIHVLKDERSKFDTKTKLCIFMDYAYEEFG